MKLGHRGLLRWKVRIFVSGACLALGGMFLDNLLLILLATTVLTGGCVVACYAKRYRYRSEGQSVDTP